MGTLAIAAPNRAYGATYSGGLWTSALPASNAGTIHFGQVARSTNAILTSTILRIDVGSVRALRFFGLVRTNLSSAATWKVKIGTSAGTSDIYAGAFLTAWPMSTSQTAMAAKGIEDDLWRNDVSICPIVLPTYYSGRYVTLEIDDTSNTAGYVEVGGVFVGGGIVPQYNAGYGLQDNHTDLSTNSNAEAGALWPVGRRRLRKVNFVIEPLTLTGGDEHHELQRMIGTVDDVLYLPNTDDMAICQRYGFIGTLKEMMPK